MTRWNWGRLSCILLAIGLLVLPAAAQDSRVFRDWQAVCDAELSCEAETHHSGENPDAYLFRLTRTLDEDSWNLVVEVRGGTPRQPYEVRAELVGADFDDAVNAATFDNPAELYLLGDAAKELMARLGPASELIFNITDADGGPNIPRFSLAGLSASLLWIDEKQGRIGSPRVAGKAPGWAVREAAAYPTDDIPEAVLDAHSTGDDCEAFEDLPDGADFSEIVLSDDATLYLLPCYSGAYNFARAAYLGRNGYVERLRFADYTHHSSWTVSNVIVNPEWDAATQRLTMFNRGRGLGDCGSIGEWQNHDGFLRLEKFFYKGECDAEGEPGDFPLIFEAPPAER